MIIFNKVHKLVVLDKGMDLVQRLNLFCFTYEQIGDYYLTNNDNNEKYLPSYVGCYHIGIDCSILRCF
jgi:hypothetical protein